MKKNIFKSVFAVAAIAAVGLGSYKAYGSYVASNMSEADLLMAENIEALALSDPGDEGNYQWSAPIQCSKKSSRTYCVCEENGKGNSCSNPGGKTCECGKNC